jgi:hypothetical protein
MLSFFSQWESESKTKSKTKKKNPPPLMMMTDEHSGLVYLLFMYLFNMEQDASSLM